MRTFALGILAGAGVLIAALPASAGSVTTRVESRAFYGATVTMEEGVRVFRPLPPHDRVIINPGNKTPLYLGINETRATSYNENHNYNPSYDASGGFPAYYGAWGNVLPHGKGDHRHGQRARGGSFPVR